MEFTPQRVTDFRVDRVTIREDDYWQLPADTRRLFETYGRRLAAPPGLFAFEIAIYRWEEIDASLRRLQAARRPEPEAMRSEP